MGRTIKLLKTLFINISILFVSCDAGIDLHNISGDVSLDPSLIVPLGGGSVSLGDLITYNDTLNLFEKDLQELNFQSFDSIEFKFKTVNLLQYAPVLTKSLYPSRNDVVTFPANFKIPLISSNQDFDLGLNRYVATERIDSVKIATATLGIVVTVENLDIDPSNLKFTLSFSDGKMRMLDGSTSSFDFTPNAFNQSQNVDITNFVMNTSGGANGIPLLITLEATTGNLPVTVGPDSKIDIEFKFNELNWEVIYGMFDLTKIASAAEMVTIGLNRKLPNGVLKLSNPQIDITAVSNIGMQLGFRLDYLKAYTNADTVYAQFDGNKSFTSLFENKPEKPGDTALIKLRTFDKDWGETNKLIENRPEILEYKFTAYSNADNDPTPNFITPDGSIKVYMKTSIPLQFSPGSYYEYNDTILNVFEPIAETLDQFTVADIESTSLVLDVINGLPVKTELSIVLLDSEDHEIRLITGFMQNYEISAGKADQNGIVQPGQQTKQQLSITFSKDQLFELRKANKIAFKVRIVGGDINSSIYFTKNDSFNLKVGLFVKGNLTTKL